MKEIVNHINVISDTINKFKKNSALDYLFEYYKKQKDKDDFVLALILYALDFKEKKEFYNANV